MNFQHFESFHDTETGVYIIYWNIINLNYTINFILQFHLLQHNNMFGDR